MVLPRRSRIDAVPHLAVVSYAAPFQRASTYVTEAQSTRQNDESGVQVAREPIPRRSNANMSDYFSARLHQWWPKEDAEAGRRSKNDVLADSVGRGGRIDALPQSSHPALAELFNEVRRRDAGEGQANSEEVWRLYQTVRKLQRLNLGNSDSSALAEASKSTEQQGSLYIPPFLYKLIVRRIAPAINVDGLPRRPRIRQIRLYLSRVASLFRQMRAVDPINLPSSSDYNHVLEVAAQSGDVQALSALWTAMTGDSTRLYALEGERSIEGAFPSPSRSTRPTSETYFQLLRGVMRHLDQQIHSMYQRAIADGSIPGYAERKRMHRQWDGDEAAYVDLYSSTGRTGRQSRQTMALATRRASGLLDEMRKQNLQFRKSTYDVVLRIMRLCGNLNAFKQLTKIAFNIDLDNPDSTPVPTSDAQNALGTKRSLDIRSLNTIIMTLGEQSTVSKMLSAYETLSRPLPRLKEDWTSETNLFATDFRGLFKGDEGEATAQVKGSESAAAIRPNTKTIETLVQFACNPPSAERLAMIQTYRTTAEMALEAKEHAARQAGTYVNLVPYLLREAMEAQRRKMLHNAQILRHDLKASQIRTMVQLFESESFGTSLALDETPSRSYAADLFDRLCFLAGTLSGQALLASSSRRHTQRRLNEDVLALQSQAQRKATISNHEAKTQAIVKQLQRTTEFVQGNVTTIAPLPLAHRKNVFCPRFETPQIGCTTAMFGPLLTHARRRHDGKTIARIGEWMRASMALYMMDLRLTNSAVDFWLGRARSLDGSSDRRTVSRRTAIRAAMKPAMQHIQHIQYQLRSLTEMYASHVQGRLHHFDALQAARKERRAEAAQEAAALLQREQEIHREAERQRAERKEAAERLRNVQKEQDQAQFAAST